MFTRFVRSYCDDRTIVFAYNNGAKGILFDRIVSTRQSGKSADVILHRGFETYLWRNYGFRSPTYSLNCEILHRYDHVSWWQ